MTGKVIIREPVEIEPRRMSSARRARIIERDGGCCTYPGCEVAVGLEIDHTIALELGGKDRDDNLKTLCAGHHKLKTRVDAGLIAQAKRRQAGHLGQKPPPTQAIRSRGFKKRWEP